jgi:predicted cation transporter
MLSSISEIPAAPVWGIAAGLIVVALLVFILPFLIKRIEHNLELFFLIMGVIAVTVSGLWSRQLVIDALKSPVMIGSVPIGIFQAVLLFGIIAFLYRKRFEQMVESIVRRLSHRWFVFLMVVVLGLISSIISVILVSVLLVEVVSALKLERKERVRLVVLTCFAAGLGAVLTPLGEPLSTILVSKLAGAPFYAGFTFPLTLFAKYVIPGVVAIGIFAAFWIDGKLPANFATTGYEDSEKLREVFLRAVKVYAFVAALVLLGEGLKPLIVWFFDKAPATVLYWVNMLSAVLDNATLTAIEVSPDMTLAQITGIIMGLLVAGGMLIPGNIPNIVAAAKLKITMKEWAAVGVPIGLALMVIYFVILIPVLFK